MKPGILPALLFTFALLLISAACAPPSINEISTNSTTAVIETPAAPASPTETHLTESSTAAGVVSGTVQVDEAFSGPADLYAIEPDSGGWIVVELMLINGKAVFQTELTPGSYKLFLHSGMGIWGGYAETGMSLTALDVQGGKDISEILITEAFLSDCGPQYGIPASPDGQYAAVESADEECLADLADAMT